MSGHSKWHNIQARKGKQDAARGKLFTKIGREIQVAVKAGGPDPDANSSLANVIAKAKANNMPNDTIANAIKKAAGAGNADNYETIVYEGYAGNGVAVIVETMTDNKNRTAADVRHKFDKAGGKLGTSGCVMYMFAKKGVIVVEKETLGMDFEQLLELMLENDAEDVKDYDEVIEIITDPEQFSHILKVLEDNNIKTLEANVSLVPDNFIDLESDKFEKLEKMVAALEDLDDVQNVYHNGQEM